MLSIPYFTCGYASVGYPLPSIPSIAAYAPNFVYPRRFLVHNYTGLVSLQYYYYYSIGTYS